MDGDHTSIFAGTLDGETGLTTVSQMHTQAQGDYYSLPDLPVIDQDELQR